MKEGGVSAEPLPSQHASEPAIEQGPALCHTAWSSGPSREEIPSPDSNNDTEGTSPAPSRLQIKGSPSSGDQVGPCNTLPDKDSRMDPVQVNSLGTLPPVMLAVPDTFCIAYTAELGQGRTAVQVNDL